MLTNATQRILLWEYEGFSTAQDNPSLLIEKEFPIGIFNMS
jgi:hypothetical protein